MSKEIFVLTGRTESGDDIGPYAWHKHPTDDEVLAVFNRDIPEEVEAGTAENWDIAKTVMEDN